VQFEAPDFWRDYRAEVFTAVAVVVFESLLIVGLLYERRARHRAELESRRNLTLAADANRRAMTSALAGSIAHELSQPLNSILHNAEAAEMLIASNRATSETLREIVSDIRLADVRATEIINRHRAMLRNRPIHKHPVDIHGVVRESVAFIANDVSAKHVRVDVDLPLYPCLVNGDQVLLQQVVVNLMMNAIDAMAQTPADRRCVTVRNEVTQSGVTVSVRDAGTGLPASFSGKLFEPFVTTKASGLGIGLTIARTIVEAHHGKLDARNNPEGGATFVVTLPWYAAAALN
jgi:C4-dicarboxylate-specific signal transduction histidine kinase